MPALLSRPSIHGHRVCCDEGDFPAWPQVGLAVAQINAGRLDEATSVLDEAARSAGRPDFSVHLVRGTARALQRRLTGTRGTTRLSACMPQAVLTSACIVVFRCMSVLKYSVSAGWPDFSVHLVRGTARALQRRLTGAIGMTRLFVHMPQATWSFAACQCLATAFQQAGQTLACTLSGAPPGRCSAV